MALETVRLIGVGLVPGVMAKTIKLGDRLMWNYGHVYLVTSVKDISPEYMEIIEMNVKTGESFTRRLKKDRLVAKITPKRNPRKPPLHRQSMYRLAKVYGLPAAMARRIRDWHSPKIFRMLGLKVPPLTERRAMGLVNPDKENLIEYRRGLIKVIRQRLPKGQPFAPQWFTESGLEDILKKLEQINPIGEAVATGLGFGAGMVAVEKLFKGRK